MGADTGCCAQKNGCEETKLWLDTNKNPKAEVASPGGWGWGCETTKKQIWTGTMGPFYGVPA